MKNSSPDVHELSRERVSWNDSQCIVSWRDANEEDEWQRKEVQGVQYNADWVADQNDATPHYEGMHMRMSMRHGMAWDVKNITFPGMQARCQSYQPRPVWSEVKEIRWNMVTLHAIWSDQKGEESYLTRTGRNQLSGPPAWLEGIVS